MDEGQWWPSTYFRGIWAEGEPRTAALALLSPAVALAVILALADPALLTAAALLLEYMLLLWGILLAAAIVSLVVAPWRVARSLALLAAGTNAAVAAVALLAAFAADPVRWWGVALVAVVCVSSGGLFLFSTRRIVSSYVVKRPRLAAIGAGLLALLPLVQFWNAALFVPAHQQTTLGAAIKADAVVNRAEAHGEVTVTLTNSGDVGALILSSELITCQRSAPPGNHSVDELHSDKQCFFDQLLGHAYELDAKSTVTFTSVLRLPEVPPDDVRILEAEAALWYARQDRVKVGDESFDAELAAAKNENCEGRTEIYPVFPNSRVQAVVQEPWRLVYIFTGLGGDSVFALQGTSQEMCGHGGVPDADKGVEDDLGLRYTSVHYEAWLPAG